jgi:hypothetical protein
MSGSTAPRGSERGDPPRALWGQSLGYGFYYDWLERKWLPRHPPRQLTAAEQQLRQRRTRLLADLIAELNDGGSVEQLYGGLLARQLISADEELMRQYGRQVAELCRESA